MVKEMGLPALFVTLTETIDNTGQCGNIERSATRLEWSDVDVQTRRNANGAELTCSCDSGDDFDSTVTYLNVQCKCFQLDTSRVRTTCTDRK